MKAALHFNPLTLEAHLVLARVLAKLELRLRVPIVLAALHKCGGRVRGWVV